MNWSKVNGDIRFNISNDEGGFAPPQGAIAGESYPGYSRGEFPRRSHMEYGPGPPRQAHQDATPKHRGGAASAILRPFTAIREHSFSHASSSRELESSREPREHKRFPSGGGRQMAYGPDFFADQDCPPFPVFSEGESACSSATVCSDCPTRGPAYDFSGSGSFFPSESECQVRGTLRTGADGRLISVDSNIPPHSTDIYQGGLPEGARPEEGIEVRQESFREPSRSGHARHASHCDLRDFQEWRDARGSHESLGPLPPDLEKHLQECRCSCDHLGYGNYQTIADGPVAHISRSHSCSTESCALKDAPPPSVYTQISYLDSPRSNSSNGLPNRRKAPGEISTKHWWVLGLVFLVAATAGVGVGVPLALRGDPNKPLEHRLHTARNILKESPLIDGHNDLPWNIRSFIHNQLAKLKLNESLKHVEPWGVSNWSHTDIPRLKEGLVGGLFWVAYTPCATQYLNAVQLTLEQLDLIKRVITKYKQYMELVTSSHDIEKVFKRGKIASMVGIEGGHSISNSLGTLRMMYELGARYLSLTHACNTPWATSSVVESEKMPGMEHVGLNDFGKKVVLEMNRLGMMVDLSHVSTQTMRDALATTVAPIIFSHSSTRALCENPRNVPDDVLKQVRTNGGIVMVSFFANHVNCHGEANVTHVAEHIKHVRRIAGIDHVGIGADFDGINKTPRGLEDVSKYPMLIAELLRDPTWSVADIRKLIGGNIIRVFAEVERVRDNLQAKGYEPYDEEIHPDYLRHHTNCTYFFD